MNYTYYIVGGYVRDKQMGVVAKDIDYAVEAPSYDAMKLDIQRAGGTIFKEDPEHFTVRANVPTLGSCDYVLCRKDGAYADGRHPTSVTIGTIFDDLGRRDFTMNALAITPDGDLLDPFNGRQDIRDNLIRCVGDTKQRFTEDGLRIFRAIRFAVTKRMTLHDDIMGCLRNRNSDWWLPRVSAKGVKVERIMEELKRAFAHDTNATLDLFSEFSDLRSWTFNHQLLWLKPTLENR